MARMHARKKGKSGSHPPLEKQMPTWVRYKGKEAELLVGKLAKEGKSSSEIGIILRDSYGIPDVKMITGKSVSGILSEKKLAPELPEDLLNLIRRAIAIRKHLDANKQDMFAKRGLQRTESKIKRLVKYYKNSKRLPADWKYDFEAVKIYAE